MKANLDDYRKHMTGKLSYNLPDKFKKAQRTVYSSRDVKLLTKGGIISLINGLNIK